MSKLTSVLRQIAEGPTPQVNAVAPLSKTERIVADNTVSRLQAIQVALEHEIADEEPLAVDGEPPRLNDDLLLVEDEVGVDFVPAQSAVATEPLAADAQLDSCQSPIDSATEIVPDDRFPEEEVYDEQDADEIARSDEFPRGVVPDVSTPTFPVDTESTTVANEQELPESALPSSRGGPRPTPFDPQLAALRDRLLSDVTPWEEGRLLMLVSVDPQSDRTQVIADLAQGLAGAAEGKVLAVDATDRTAQECEDDGDADDRQLGLDSILTDGRLDPEAIIATPTEGLDILRRGQDALLARKLNDELIARTTAALREQYEFVLVDGGDWGNALVPRLASHMDAVYLCVQANWTTEAAARQALRQLGRTGVRVSGCLLLGTK